MKDARCVIKEILKIHRGISSITFSRYVPTLKHFEEKKKEDPTARRRPHKALEHLPLKLKFQQPREEILNGCLDLMIETLRWEEALQVHSPVLKGKRLYHIPMLDFRIEPTKEHLGLIIDSLRATGQKEGVILESGGSYHFYGFELLSHKKWIEFMLKSLLFDNLVDHRWIGHRLLDEFACLRVSKKGPTGFIPELAKLL